MIGKFLTPLVTRHIAPERKSLEQDLVYEGANKTIYTAPAGFFSDGASVPRLLWALYPPFGEAYEPAAWLHDYLYCYAENVYGTDKGNILSRAEADGLFYEAMETCCFRRTGRETVYRAVRLGGWKPWRRYRAEARERAAARPPTDT